MTDQEINIAIAEACGRKYHKPTEEEVRSGSYYQYEPDYCNDLNAMHAAEGVLSDDSFIEYHWRLYLLTRPKDKDMWKHNRAFTSATARQRAEAFLCTFGKWRVS